eukprot:scaffold28332_cov31-Tisochrysis_lutea.AAC.3
MTPEMSFVRRGSSTPRQRDMRPESNCGIRGCAQDRASGAAADAGPGLASIEHAGRDFAV